MVPTSVREAHWLRRGSILLKEKANGRLHNPKKLFQKQKRGQIRHAVISFILKVKFLSFIPLFWHLADFQPFD
jgi:hypothetical protein